MNKPFVTFVFPSEREDKSTRYAGFARRLKKAGGLEGYDTLTVALENLAYVIEEDGSAHVIDTVSGVDLASSSFVYLKSWEAMPEEACALATYLHFKGVPFIDSLSLNVGVSKLTTMFKLWSEGVAVPLTVYVRRNDRLKKFLASGWGDRLGATFIVKDIVGAKGKLNFLSSFDEAQAILGDYPDVHFMCQRFVVNDGDYRVGIYIEEPGFIIKRVGSGESHLNNVSAGGRAEYIDIEKAPKKLIAIAKKASRASSLQVSGVDIIIDKETGKAFVLEVNQGSQIVTGAFVEQNIAAFNKALGSAVRERYTRARKQPTRMIGRRATAKLSLLGVSRIVAKIDTGAYSSTLHAENIHIRENEDGTKELVFNVVPGEHLSTKDGEVRTVTTTDFFDQKVRSSNGQIQHRYSIKTRISIEGRVFPVVLTLSDRSEMGYPLLIGRRVLRSRFIVNVELNEDNDVEWSY